MSTQTPNFGIPMRRFGYLVAAVVYTGAVFMAGMLIGQLYAVYVMIFTGGVFMIGLWVGQWWERSWKVRQREEASLREDLYASSNSQGEIRKRSELTFR